MQMRAELLLVRVQHVQAAIEPRVVDLAEGHAQQIFQRAVGIPALGHLQFAASARRSAPASECRPSAPRAPPPGPARSSPAAACAIPAAATATSARYTCPKSRTRSTRTPRKSTCAHCGCGAAGSGWPSSPLDRRGRAALQQIGDLLPSRAACGSPVPAPCPTWRRLPGAAPWRCAPS